MNQKKNSTDNRIGLVITGGEAPIPVAAAPYLEHFDFLIAADSGLDRVIEYGLIPDLIVGDMDSLKDSSYLNNFDDSRIKRYPMDKDYTDTELALKELEGFGKKILIGGGEGRLDHTLALLALFEGSCSPDVWITGREIIFPAHTSQSIEGREGQLISFYPIGDRNIKFTSEGLHWPLDGVNWQGGELSLSNRFTGKSIKLTQHQGRLLVIQSLTEFQA